MYRSEDIKNISRLASPKVCGYMSAEAPQLLPEKARTAAEAQKAGGEHQLQQHPVRLKGMKLNQQYLEFINQHGLSKRSRKFELVLETHWRLLITVACQRKYFNMPCCHLRRIHLKWKGISEFHLFGFVTSASHISIVISVRLPHCLILSDRHKSCCHQLLIASGIWII